MSRRSRYAKSAARSASAASGATAAPPAASAAGFDFGSWGTNGHQGAATSRNRGYVYFPELDTRREISSYTRLEMLRKGRFLYANHGIAKRAVNGLARMVAGTGLSPQAATKDRLWNAEAEAIFAADTSSPFVFDVGGRYNFESSQQGVKRFQFRDGDCAAALASSAAGRGRLRFYEGHCIGNAGTMPSGQDQEKWNDGVRTDANDAALGYRFPQDDGTYRDIDANDLIFFCDYERGGQSRGLTILAHAINHLLDVAEITGFIKTGVKLANQYGFWIEQAAGTTKPTSGAGDRVGGSKTVVTTPAGDVTLERILGGGQIPDLQPGQSLKFNASSHPHPNNLTLMEFLIRDIAWGCGVSPELLWNIVALGGANTRFVMADAQGWIEEQQAHLVRSYCQRVWVYVIAKAIKSGRLRAPYDAAAGRPAEWWACHWITPPRLTVDFGRDGKLHLEQLKAGVITYSRLLGWQGQDFEPHTNQWLDELAYVKAGLNKANAAARKPDDRNLTWSDIAQWRNLAGNVAANGGDFNTGAIADDGPTTGNGSALAYLEELAKNPTRAAAELARLRALPEAA